MVDCIEEVGRELNINNQGIVRYLCGIEEERRNLETIIHQQYQERKRVEADIERLTYKLCLINKSLSMRIRAKNNYDKTVEEIKGHYAKLVDSSNKLRLIVEKTQQDLDGMMNKKTGTCSENEEIKTLYVKSGGDPNTCPCNAPSEIPTKETSESVTQRPATSQTPLARPSIAKPRSQEEIEQEILNQNFIISEGNSDVRKTTWSDRGSVNAVEIPQANGAKPSHLPHLSMSSSVNIYESIQTPHTVYDVPSHVIVPNLSSSHQDMHEQARSSDPQRTSLVAREVFLHPRNPDKSSSADMKK